MCGRYVLYGPGSRIIEGFSIRDLPPFTPRYNIAPTADVLAILVGKSGERIARPMRWGLVPGWANDAAIGARLNNARAESVDQKPAFRNAFRRWRCLLPANGFYEWRAAQDPKARKQPFYIHPADPQALFAMAGLMERWNGPQGPLYTCCVITTDANAPMARIHDRMPVLLQPSQYDAWLDPGNDDLAALKAMLQPAPPALVAIHAVDPAVNQARNEGAQLIEPVTLVGDPLSFAISPPAPETTGGDQSRTRAGRSNA